jgi:hypothetical protein
MGSITVERVRERRTIAVEAAVAYLGAAAFVVAAVWATLVARGITVPSEPAGNPALSVHQNQMLYLRWLIAKQPQERLSSTIAIVAFLCLVATAVALRDRFRAATALGVLGVLGVGSGVIVWIVERVLHLGGNYGIGKLATHHYSTDTVTGIGFTLDSMTRALDVTAFALIGLGMLAFALEGLRGSSRAPRWGAWTAATGIAMLVAAWSSLAASGTLGDVLVAIVGVILLPVWMVWTSRELHG